MGTDENKFQRVDWDHDGPLASDDDEHGLPVQPPRGPGLSADDLELLTLAARAIGAVQVEPVEGEQWVNLHFADGSTAWNWNPLLHSDDTEDLMARLNLAVSVNHEDHMDGNKSVVVMWDDPNNPDAGTADMHADPRVAIKRAVTRAAAEIGRANL